MQLTECKGFLGEFIAAFLLKIKGYTILARRYKTSCGEIDIVAKKRNMLVFVEVKSRKSVEKCYNAITHKQINRIQHASEIFLSRSEKFHECNRRYDIILVSDWKWPIHIENITN